MEYINDINVNEAIVHILDSVGSEPVLNEFKLELDKNTYKFIYRHIQKCLANEDLKYAKFNNERNVVKDLVKDYLNGNSNNLIEISKELARQLFSLIKCNVSIPSGDLIVASIITDKGPMIAILKLDYVENFTHEINFIEKKIGIGLTTQMAGLPSSGQRIQKAAFIKPIREGDSFNLMILNKQKGSKEEESYGADYFINNFLGCSFITNERDMTKILLNTTENWTRKNFANDAVKAEEIRNSIKTKLKEDEVINIADLSEELFKDVPDVKEDFQEVLISKGLNEAISVDKTWIDKKLTKRKLKLENGIELVVPEDIYNDPKQFKIENNNDGSINLIIGGVSNYVEK